MFQADPNKNLKVLGWSLHGLGVLITLLVLLTELIIYRPIDNRVAACDARLGELQVLLKDRNRVRAEHTRLSRELAAAQKQAATLQTRIPDEPQEADFLAQVAKLAGEVDLQIRDYRPGAVTRKPSYSAIRVDLVCEGDYASICRFLAQLAELPRHSTITRLQIDADNNRPQYSAEISLRLYFAAKGRLNVDQKGATDA